jgi:hypothetical protein
VGGQRGAALLSSRAHHWGYSALRLHQGNFYAPEAHIMYLTVSSSFLISFVMHLSGPSRVIKFLNAPERPEQGD